MNRSINVPFDELRFPSSVLIQELVGCGDPGVPVHGYKTGENYWAGQMVTFTCDTGYHLEGPTNRLCLEGGNWSDVMPTCECSYINRFTPIGINDSDGCHGGPDDGSVDDDDDDDDDDDVLRFSFLRPPLL